MSRRKKNRKTPSIKRKAEERLRESDFRDIRLPPSNRHGGNQLQNLEGLPGGTYGRASKCRRYSEKEKKALEAELEATGRI